MKNLSLLSSIVFLSISFLFSSCNRNRSNPREITMRPRVFVENAAPVPIIDEYDFRNVQIGTIDNIFTDDPDDRTYALWFSLDRRSSIILQKRVDPKKRSDTSINHWRPTCGLSCHTGGDNKWHHSICACQ